MFEFSNRMQVPDRQPYVGDLVFTAFSGSHQDAIKKGMADIYDVQPGRRSRASTTSGTCPTCRSIPRHLGRSYEAVIRVNSQSGKGGVAYVLLHEYGLDLPRQLQVDFSKKIQKVTEDTGTEITSYEIHRRFMAEYVEPTSPQVEIIGHRSSSDTLESGTTTLEAKLIVDGVERMVTGEGNGPIDAFVHALQAAELFDGKIVDYSEHTMGTGSDATAVAYVEIDNGARDTVLGRRASTSRSSPRRCAPSSPRSTSAEEASASGGVLGGVASQPMSNPRSSPLAAVAPGADHQRLRCSPTGCGGSDSSDDDRNRRRRGTTDDSSTDDAGDDSEEGDDDSDADDGDDG